MTFWWPPVCAPPPYCIRGAPSAVECTNLLSPFHSHLSSSYSVLQYAVEVLKVSHIMVVGHYGCGGIKAATESRPHGLIDNWLRHIQDVEALYDEELRHLEGEARLDRLCELNVIAQAKNVSRTPILRAAWDRGQLIEVHSWIYSLKDGRLKPLMEVLKAPYAPSTCHECQKEDASK